MPVAMSIPIPEEDVAVLGQKHSPGSRKKKALSLASKNLNPVDEKGVDLMVGDSNVHPEEIQEPGLKAGSSIQILVESLFGNNLALVIDTEDTTDKLESDIRENSSCLLSVVRLLHGTEILKPGVSMANRTLETGTPSTWFWI
jgi:hypothetical protein